jgi:hypothetical protein
MQEMNAYLHARQRTLVARYNRSTQKLRTQLAGLDASRMAGRRDVRLLDSIQRDVPVMARRAA